MHVTGRSVDNGHTVAVSDATGRRRLRSSISVPDPVPVDRRRDSRSMPSANPELRLHSTTTEPPLRSSIVPASAANPSSAARKASNGSSVSAVPAPSDPTTGASSVRLKPAGLNEWRGDTAAGVPWRVIRGDSRQVLRVFPDNRFDCVVTSPPYYWQRNYDVPDQIGLEPTIDAYVNSVASTMEEVRRVLHPHGLLFLNLADTYYSAKGQPKGPDKKNRARRFGLRAVDASGLGVPRKTVIGIPWRVALAMIASGWVLRSPIVWKRDTPMPEPTAKDRPWRTYEMVFMFSKSQRYNFDRSALAGDEDIWTISARPKSSKGLHSASFPDELVQKCLDVGCASNGEVLDPFAGTGTTLKVAVASGRPAVGVDLKLEFCEYMAKSLTAI